MDETPDDWTDEQKPAEQGAMVCIFCEEKKATEVTFEGLHGGVKSAGLKKYLCSACGAEWVTREQFSENGHIIFRDRFEAAGAELAAQAAPTAGGHRQGSFVRLKGKPMTTDNECICVSGVTIFPEAADEQIDKLFRDLILRLEQSKYDASKRLEEDSYHWWQEQRRTQPAPAQPAEAVDA
jgi:hypothetical protein